MDKEVHFSVDCSGLCSDCNGKSLFSVPVPDNWDGMTEEEKQAWAREEFFGEMEWTWWESV